MSAVTVSEMLGKSNAGLLNPLPAGIVASFVTLLADKRELRSSASEVVHD